MERRNARSRKASWRVETQIDLVPLSRGQENEGPALEDASIDDGPPRSRARRPFWVGGHMNGKRGSMRRLSSVSGSGGRALWACIAGCLMLAAVWGCRHAGGPQPGSTPPSSAHPGLGVWASPPDLRHASGNGGLEFHAVGMGVVPERRGEHVVTTPDGRHAAMVVEAEGGLAVWIDGQIGRTFRRIDPGSLILSPDGHRCAFAASDATQDVAGCWFMVVDGKRHGTYDRIISGSPLFSRDGRRFAYAAEKGGSSLVIVDGHVQLWGLGPVASTRDGGIPGGSSRLLFGPDGRHLVCVVHAVRGMAVAVDGKLGESYDWVSPDSLVFSGDGSHLAYIAGEGASSFVVRDGVAGTGYEAIASDSVSFSADGKHLVYASKGRRRWHIVVDGTSVAEGDAVMEGTPVLSPEGLRFAYVIMKDGAWSVVVDDVAGPGYDAIGGGSLTFSPDGKHVAYAAMRGGRWAAVIDGQRGPWYDAVAQIVFSPDSQSWAYSAATNGKWSVVWDGRPGPAAFVGIGDVRFSRNSRHLAYAAGLTEDAITVVVDQLKGPEYDDLVQNGPSFREDGVVEFIAMRDGAFLRVNAAPRSPTLTPPGGVAHP